MIDITQIRIGNVITEKFPLATLEITLTKEKMIEVLNNPERYEGLPITQNHGVYFGKLDGRTDDCYLELWFTGNDVKSVHLSYGTYVSYDVEVKNIKHLHQLQNLYHSLTGEELTLK